jgi:D-alanyl-D-alanine carboxypeptidase (penicillin-binding protein 5/6)
VVTLLGAEPRPQRGWQQGRALLDWGFTVPQGASVGRLVNPGELTAGTPSPTTTAAVAPQTVATAGPARMGPPIAVLCSFVAAAGLLAGFLRRRRLRRR